MDEGTLQQNLGEELIGGWDIAPTGSGFLVISDWRWPNNDRIEVFVRTVGEREDLYVVTDGGDLFNFLFSHGIDLSRDEQGMRVFKATAKNYGAEILEYQIVKGANATDLAHAIRQVVEAIKDSSLLLWHKLNLEGTGDTYLT